ncbi:hypothetical protein GCM10009678_14320 [Actinomadura kijaniata]|uniref:Acyl carrier protein n=1 Tax=Actinomadura namibiensis TaxID=182080 RepID=A0A7W3QN17_ACTNM|nr:phosphopantetheine-binding protein [Actinomadura namibiensis]MBA8952603.1 acyl carrier protein [Actinomadura namibiensis]
MSDGEKDFDPEIYRQVREPCVKVFTAPLEEVTPEARPVAGLGADSLDFSELAEGVTETFGISLTEEDVRGVETVADVPPQEIRQVNAHGPATQLNDTAEANALRRAFGETPPPVTAPKGVLGHLMGAAGAVEAVAGLLSASRGLAPPVANHENRAEDCPLDVVTGGPRHVGAGPVLSNSFGFGGHNACLVLGPPPE